MSEGCSPEAYRDCTQRKEIEQLLTALKAQSTRFCKLSEEISSNLKKFVSDSSKRTCFALEVAEDWIDQYEEQVMRAEALELELKTTMKYDDFHIEKYNNAKQKVAKQRAIIKKLGDRSVKWHKKAISERASKIWNPYDENRTWDKCIKIAREQLQQEEDRRNKYDDRG